MLNLSENTVLIRVKGKRINGFVQKLNQYHIDIYNIDYVKKDEIIIKTKLSDLSKINDIKSIFKIEILKASGPVKIKKQLKNNIHIIIMTIIAIIILKIFSSLILDIKVLHNDPLLRKTILVELENEGISKYKFKKSYAELNKIKNKIKNKYNDKIEWLEIETKGTKYIVRVEERIIDKNKKQNKSRHVVSKKDALLLDIDAKKGEIVKNKNDYVKKGDIVISGSITMNDNITNKDAEGSIYGEVWYKAKIEYPLNYLEKKKSQKTKKVLIFKFLNHEIRLFDFKRYKKFFKKRKILFKNNVLPVSLIEEIDTEIILKKHKYSVNQATNLAQKKLIKQIKSNLKKKEHIIDTKKLKVEQNNSKIILELFISVYENITEYVDIEN